MLDALKVGVAGVASDRLTIHSRHGWSILRTVTFDRGADALTAESEVLAAVRRRGYKSGIVEVGDMPQSGRTETFSVCTRVTADAVLDQYAVHRDSG
ncbi:MAG: hypothetical protein ACYDC9_13630, partial [Dermatophilaceae bacterium]